MAQLPEVKQFSPWLFAKDLKNDGDIFECAGFDLEHKTKNDKECPILILLGETEKDVGEFQLAIWNIKNFNQLRKDIGTDTDAWKGKKLKLWKKGERFHVEVA